MEQIIQQISCLPLGIVVPLRHDETRKLNQCVERNTFASLGIRSLDLLSQVFKSWLISHLGGNIDHLLSSVIANGDR